ncbi:glutamine amidotransferase [Ferrigenium kumadai]|uniref:Glutamine amidotransferase n=1 Tax=Ferrigenium kumadai TaxID=1682490 RepID=A0AAN1SZC8_9PROT|nr:DJ-1/PfpI family protein [Ferrigenium kumadai]BBI99880.1 glutamine amidotransferase [Ferrigenium kumadai]
MTVAVAIYLFPDSEVLDFAGPYEVFTCANRVFKRLHPEAEDIFRVFTVARDSGLLRARAGLEVKPDFTIESHPVINVLIVPGGVITAELERREVIDWIASQHSKTMLTASVCTGAFLLAKAGLLRGKSATTHWEDIPDLRAMFPDLPVRENRRWIDEGAVVTSAGISAGIDMCLHLVERLASRELALATARQLEVEWHDNA